MDEAVWQAWWEGLALGWLVVCRVAPVVWWSPLFVGGQASGVVRVAVALGLGAALWPTAWASVPEGALGMGGWGLVGLSVREVLVGGALAFVVAQVFWAAQIAGGLMNSAASQEGQGDGLWGEGRGEGGLLVLLASALFVASGGLVAVVGALGRSWEVLPLLGSWGQGWAEAGLGLATRAGGVLGLGLILALPVIGARWAAEVGLGMALRAAPQAAEILGGLGMRAWWGLLAALLALRVVAEIVVGEAGQISASWLGWLENLR